MESGPRRNAIATVSPYEINLFQKLQRGNLILKDDFLDLGLVRRCLGRSEVSPGGAGLPQSKPAPASSRQGGIKAQSVAQTTKLPQLFSLIQSMLRKADSQLQRCHQKRSPVIKLKSPLLARPGVDIPGAGR